MTDTRVWITWENQRRNRELSSALGMRLFEFAEVDATRGRFRKYRLGVAKTLGALAETRPRLVVCQNPSIVLAFLLSLLRGSSRFALCVDAHNAGLFPCEGTSRVLGAASRLVLRAADLTIVTNEMLAAFVRRQRGRPFVLPDRIPDPPTVETRRLDGITNLVFVCSFAADEPYKEVIAAAKTLDARSMVYITGNYRKAGIDPQDVPSNVTLTGFVPEPDYWQLIRSADATIDLTTREDCLVCGAYETLAVARPMILSGTRALREYFSGGAVYVDNTRESIAAAMREVVARGPALSADAARLRDCRRAEWEVARGKLEALLRGLECNVRRAPR